MKSLNNKGITLIALMVTIVILLILAGISIGALTGDNGIIKYASKAKIQTQISEEKEALEENMMLLEYQYDEKYALGEPLYDKTMDNSTIWDLIVLDGKTYGTNWKYIAKNTDISDYGKAKYEWLVNYKTGETICLNNEEYTRLTHGQSLGVTDGLIFNLDPSVIDDTDTEVLKNGDTSILGKNVELMNFDWDEESGLTPTTFNFDGIDDYIKVQYDSTEEKNTLAQNGFTFEYYGILNGGTSYNASGEIINSPYKGIFAYWNGREEKQAVLRFGILNNQPLTLQWNAASTHGAISDYSAPNDEWNILYPIDNYEYGNEIYYTITLDTTNSYQKEGEEYYKAILYMNGKKLYEGGYNIRQWENFVTKYLESLNYFCIGRCSMSRDGYWHYSKMNAYTLRLYNKALTEEQVKDNYQKSVAYYGNISLGK